MLTHEMPPEIQRLIADQNSTLARLNAHLVATIPAYVEEFQTSGTIGTSITTTMNIPPARDTYFKVTGIYVSVPFGTVSATLQLGSQFIMPLQNTTTLLSPIQRILTSGDIRQLIFTTGSSAGGVAFAWLWGEAIPKYGVL